MLFFSSYKILPDIREKIEKQFDADYVPVYEHPNLLESEAAHADMQLFKLSERKLLVAPDTKIDLKLITADVEIVNGTAALSKAYPQCVAYNIKHCGSLLYGKSKVMAPEIKQLAQNNGLQIIDTKQGYASCSMLYLDLLDLYVTGDNGLSMQLKALGKKVFQLTDSDLENIILEGSNNSHGFIGGATYYSKKHNAVVANGSMSKSIPKLYKFLCENSVKVIESESVDKLWDIGGILLM